MKKFRPHHLILPALLAAGCAGQAYAASYEREIQPLLVEFCYDCHGDGADKGGVQLDKYPDQATLLADVKTWAAARNNLRAHIMPPPGKPQPTDPQRARITQWIEEAVFNVDCASPDPGRVTLRRLNRIEYNNTIRDLLGVDFKPASDFPQDDSGYGFDNIGDVLTLSPLHMENYLAAAREIVQRAIAARPRGLEPRKIPRSRISGGQRHSEGRILASSGTITAQLDVAENGEYKIRIEAFGDQAGPDPARMGVKLDGKDLGHFEVKAKTAQPHDRKTNLTQGRHQLELAFLNDYYITSGPPELRGDRNLIVSSVALVGPLNVETQLPSSHHTIFFKQPGNDNQEQTAREIIGHFATRAYRRPPSEPQLDRLMQLWSLASQNQETFEASVGVALQAILVSPHFLFRGELRPGPNNAANVVPVDDFALASRLSYFLWSTTPDQDLMFAAARGTLRQNLDQQVRRMLKDQRISALAENFGSQWLQTRSLDRITPSTTHFPWTDELKEAMRRETELFTLHIVRNNRSVLEFLTADYTFLNEPLARHYGINNVSGPSFQQVSLQDTPRRGVLTHASVLTVTSNPTRTSPVKRGLWVLENILGTPAPAAPPTVESLDESEQAVLTGSLRQRFEKHRSSAICNSCHQRMDPLGFGFENFDAVGRWRTQDHGFDIDTTGRLISGETFETPLELIRILGTSKQEEFLRCLAERLLTYALGRGLEYFDVCAVDQIVARLREAGYHFHDLILAIVKSPPFQLTRGEAPAP